MIRNRPSLNKLIPNSSIPYVSQKTYRIDIEDNPRILDIEDQELLDEIDELTDLLDTYSFLVKGYVCSVKIIKDSEIIEEPFILIGNNDFTWESESYIKSNNKYYFTKPGSCIKNDHKKQYFGPPLRVVLGKKISSII